MYSACEIVDLVKGELDPQRLLGCNTTTKKATKMGRPPQARYWSNHSTTDSRQFCRYEVIARQRRIRESGECTK